MWSILHITPWSLQIAVTLDIVKIMKNILTFSCKSLKFLTKVKIFEKKRPKNRGKTLLKSGKSGKPKNKAVFHDFV